MGAFYFVLFVVCVSFVFAHTGLSFPVGGQMSIVMCLHCACDACGVKVSTSAYQNSVCCFVGPSTSLAPQFPCP